MKAGRNNITPEIKSIVSEVISKLGAASVYESSIHSNGSNLFFLVRSGRKKYLIIAGNSSERIRTRFVGKSFTTNSYTFVRCELSHENTKVLRDEFVFTNPILIGKVNSYGFGDRLGNANPAHVRAVKESELKPVLAQQSIRELDRTGRTAEEVMDAASWAVFQEGYHEGFGADADHLKTSDDVDRMIRAGYTMFTIDPSEYVVNEVSTLSTKELETKYKSLPWSELEDIPNALLDRFVENDIPLVDDCVLTPSTREVLEGMVKYGRVITHTNRMAKYISKTYPEHPAELELSVDETDEPTTLFEHYLVASELNRLGVELVSLAPRFCGHFEKGIDFKGDLDQFREEYIQHLAIAEMFGGYKLSIHSGSDKFSVYEVIGSINRGAVHVKTAGTSYLEALRTVAEADSKLFREILSFSIERFEEDKKTYHISAKTENIGEVSELSKEELINLLDDNDARQILHVAYGSVLSGRLPIARDYKERLMDVLEENEYLHESNLIRHFMRHLSPFMIGAD